MALKSDETVWDWGQNSVDELGVGLAQNNITCNSPYYVDNGTFCFANPIQVICLNNIVDIRAGLMYGRVINRIVSQALFVQSGGNVYTMGFSMTTPEQVTGLSNVITAQFGFNNNIISLQNDGTVDFAYINNVNCSTNAIGTPAQLSGITKVTDIAVGGNHLMMLSAQ